MGLGVVAIADPPTAIRLKVPFSDGLGGGDKGDKGVKEDKDKSCIVASLS